VDGRVDIPRATAISLAGDVREGFIGREAAAAAEIAVCEGDRLLGLVSLEQLVAADPDTPLAMLIEGEPVAVGPDADLESVALQAVHRGARSVAVVDDSGRFLGVLPPERLISTLESEHEEDMARLGGFLAGTGLARTASEEAVPRRLWHRLPWLALGLAGAMVSAGIVASFEDELEAQVLLAFFVPAVVYMADAVGTQTETLVIRGMAIGVPLRRIVRSELATGLVIGILLAVSFFAFALAIWGNASVAATVALALFVSASLATLIAMTLPYLLARLGRDPAFGSGPLATVLQDLLSIIVYFAIAAVLV
jgi:magnesium transporter